MLQSAERPLSPYVRRAWDHDIATPWHLRERVLWDYELLYLKEGTLLVTIGDRVYEGHPGDLFLFKPMQRHSIRSVGTVRIRQPHVHFDLQEQADSAALPVSFLNEKEMTAQQLDFFRPDLLSDGQLVLPNHMRLRHPAVFEQILFDLVTEFKLKLPYYEIQMKGLLLKLLTYLIRERHWAETPQVEDHLRLLLNVQQYLTHHTHCNITLDQLSSMFHISKYYLARLFRDAFHMSPIHYHQTVRLEKAKQLIQFTDLSMQSIALQLGYNNIHAFSRAFKNNEGISPSHMRRRQSGN